jgi:hypothetical protein
VKRLAADRRRWKSFVAALCSYTGDNRKWWCLILVRLAWRKFYFSCVNIGREGLASNAWVGYVVWVPVLIARLWRQLDTSHVQRGDARGYKGASVVCWHSVDIRVGVWLR